MKGVAAVLLLTSKAPNYRRVSCSAKLWDKVAAAPGAALGEIHCFDRDGAVEPIVWHGAFMS